MLSPGLGKIYGSSIHWIQEPKISPDGKYIAFSYKGNIFKISARGGNAIALTHDSTYKTHPIWSHDSKKIAYASYQYGNEDVFLVSVAGGKSKRLTFDSANDIPYDFSLDNKNVLFGSNRQELYTSIRFPASTFITKVFEVPITGGNSRLINGAGMSSANYNKTGDQLIFEDRKSFEDSYRKHQLSSVARDIWTYNLKMRSYKKLSSFIGEDREPIWGDGDNYYYLTEKYGSQNIVSASVSNPNTPVRLTFFRDHPVRSLSRSVNGLLCFSFDGNVYTVVDGKKPILVPINLNNDDEKKQNYEVDNTNSRIGEMTVSKDGKQIAFVVKGDIFVCSANGDSVKQITKTPFEERMPDFSPDGRSLIFSAEHEKSWDIVRVKSANPDCKYLFENFKISLDTVIGGLKDEFQGKYSPDGNKIAYLEEREILKTYNLLDHSTNIIVPEGVNFSNRDGSQYFAWSPNSDYLLYESTEGGGGYDNDIAIIKDDGIGKRINLTNSGFRDERPQWGLSGALIYWLNDSKGMRSFTSESQTDVFAMFLDNRIWYDYHYYHKLPTPPLSGYLNRETDYISGALLDSNGLSSRTERFTTSSGEILSDVLSNDGKRLYTLQRTENGFDLVALTISTHDRKILAHFNAGSGTIYENPDFSIIIFSEGNISKYIEKDGNTIDITPKFNSVHDHMAERSYMLSHIWKVKKKRLLDPKLNNVDLDSYYNYYRKFLPYINNDFDFQILVNEFLGELNLSHNFITYFPDFKSADQTAALGLSFDLTRNGPGLLVKDVLKGGPFDKQGTKMKPAMMIDSIDGKSVNGICEWQNLLNHKAGKATRVVFHSVKERGYFSDTVVAVSGNTNVNNLLYNAWIRKMEHLTDSLSNGKLGYVYLRQMDDDSFRLLYSAALGRYKNKLGLIVDTRYNRGGSLHDQLITFLTGKLYLTERRQGRLTNGGESLIRWTKPSCVVVNEANYSDGFLFPYVYKELRVGNIVGMPVAGTGTQVWYEQQIDDNFGLLIPQGGTYGLKDISPTENRQLFPDIQVNDDYLKVLNGKDQQIETAITELLKTVKKL